MIICFISNLYSQEENARPKEEVGQPFSGWSFQYSFGKGRPEAVIKTDPTFSEQSLFLLSTPSSSLYPLLFHNLTDRTQKLKGDSYHFRLYGEYLFHSGRFGFLTGISRVNSVFTYIQPDYKNYAAVLPVVRDGNGADSAWNAGRTGVYMSIFIQSLYEYEQKFSYTVHYWDFGMTYHILPGYAVDPYVSFGAGPGTCGSGCSAVRGFAKLGLRFNIEDRYFFLEAEKSAQQIQQMRIHSRPVFDAVGIFGYGLKF